MPRSLTGERASSSTTAAVRDNNGRTRQHVERQGIAIADPVRLLERWRSGDARAFEEVVDCYHGPLLSFLVSTLHHLQDAEDVAQETFLRAHRSVQQLRDPERLWEWLKRIAHNLAMDRLAGARRAGVSKDPDEIQRIAEKVQGNGQDEGDDPDDARDVLSLDSIVRAIEELPETYRQVAVYHYLQEWPYGKIAQALGIEPGAARQRISRANKLLRSALGQRRTERMSPS